MSLISFEQRVRPYESIFNFRDFGGYAAAGGRRVVTDTLFRSAHLANLSNDDMADIAGLGIDLVVDMRHAPERVRAPSRWSPDNVLTLPAHGQHEKKGLAPHEAFAKNELNSAADGRRYMMGSYTQRPHDEGFKTIHRDALLALTEPGEMDVDAQMNETGRGVLIHCAAGKDRTGTICALILGLLGVSDDDIMSDYLLTREAVDIESILEPASKSYEQRYGRSFEPDHLRPIFGVDADYLRASLETMGPYEDYARDMLEIDDARLDRLRRRYTRPA